MAVSKNYGVRVFIIPGFLMGTFAFFPSFLLKTIGDAYKTIPKSIPPNHTLWFCGRGSTNHTLWFCVRGSKNHSEALTGCPLRGPYKGPI